jgi:hypothetical protein
MGIKKIIISTYLLMITTTFYGQSFVSGVGLTYGTSIKWLGLNVREYYFIKDHICFGPEFSYFPKPSYNHTKKTLFEFNFTGHYIFEINHHFGIYPLTGLNYSYEIVKDLKDKEKTGSLGINLGVGMHHKIKNTFPYIEYKFVTGKLSQHVMSVGILFSFSNT